MLLTAMLAAGVSWGCQRTQPPQTQEVALVADPVAGEASVHRVWDPQTVVVPTGAVVAGTTRMRYAPTQETSDGARLIEEPVLFAGQVVMVPFTYFFTPPFKQRVYESWRVPPTETAVQRMPEAPDQSLTGRTDSGKTIPPVTAGLGSLGLASGTSDDIRPVPQPSTAPAGEPSVWEIP